MVAFKFHSQSVDKCDNHNSKHIYENDNNETALQWELCCVQSFGRIKLAQINAVHWARLIWWNPKYHDKIAHNEMITPMTDI